MSDDMRDYLVEFIDDHGWPPELSGLFVDEFIDTLWVDIQERAPAAAEEFCVDARSAETALRLMAVAAFLGWANGIMNADAMMDKVTRHSVTKALEKVLR